MPLALVGFTLQSFPLESSTALSSRLVPSSLLIDHPLRDKKQASCVEVDQPSINAPKDNSAQQMSGRKGVNPLPSPCTSCTSVTRCRRSILSWVWCLLGELTVWSQPEGYPLLYFSPSASRVRRYFRVFRTRWWELFPKVQLTPFRLCCPSQFTSSNVEDAVGLIISPHAPGCLTVPCIQSLTAPPTTRSTGWCECRAPVNSHNPLRPNERCSLPTAALPLQSIENQAGWTYLSPGMIATLMVLSRSPKRSISKLEHYWFCSPFVTFMHADKDVQWVFKVFIYCSTTAETIDLPWPFDHL